MMKKHVFRPGQLGSPLMIQTIIARSWLNRCLHLFISLIRVLTWATSMSQFPHSYLLTLTSTVNNSVLSSIFLIVGSVVREI